jgi:hypothetical protein
MKRDKRYSFARTLLLVFSVLVGILIGQIVVAQVVPSTPSLGFSTPGRLYVGFGNDAHNTVGFYVASPSGDVEATDGTHTDKVVVTWPAQVGATGYRVYRDGVDISGLLGLVLTYDDTSADAGSINPGTASASDGTSTTYVRLLISGEAAVNGTTHTYSVSAVVGGVPTSIDQDDGYRGVGALTYQWQRSAADSNATYSSITGATTEPYNDVTGVTDPDGRYYRCVISGTGAATVTTAANRGYMAAGGSSATVGRNMLGGLMPLAFIAAIFVGVIRAMTSKRRDLLGRVFKGVVNGGIFFIIMYGLLEVLF